MECEEGEVAFLFIFCAPPPHIYQISRKVAFMSKGKQLKDRDLDFIAEQFNEKDEVLSNFCERVSAETFYEDIFGSLDNELPVVIIDDEAQKHIMPMRLDEALQQAKDRNDILLGGCSYFNHWISKKSAKDIYTLIIDMDNVYSGTLLNAFQDEWYTASGSYLPKPTYIVNSGTGLHLYFVFTEPIPNYKATTENLDKLYRKLAVEQTTNRVYLHKQVQWFGQDFRVAGGLNKYGWENSVYRYNDKWDIDELAKALNLDLPHFTRYGEKRAKSPLKIASKRIKRKGWKSNRAFYDYSLQNCRNKTKEGNRYTSMCALTVIAYKCDVPIDELERDLLSLLPIYNDGATREIKPKEIKSALKMYNQKAMLTQRESLEHWQGWDFKPIKRNGRKRAEHIKIMNFVRDEINGNKEWRNKEGRPNKADIVARWRAEHPNGTKAECIKATGLSKPTVYKWWNETVDNATLTNEPFSRKIRK